MILLRLVAQLSAMCALSWALWFLWRKAEALGVGVEVIVVSAVLVVVTLPFVLIGVVLLIAFERSLERVERRREKEREGETL